MLGGGLPSKLIEIRLAALPDEHADPGAVWGCARPRPHAAPTCAAAGLRHPHVVGRRVDPLAEPRRTLRQGRRWSARRAHPPPHPPTPPSSPHLATDARMLRPHFPGLPFPPTRAAAAARCTSRAALAPISPFAAVATHPESPPTPPCPRRRRCPSFFLCSDAWAQTAICHWAVRGASWSFGQSWGAQGVADDGGRRHAERGGGA